MDFLWFCVFFAICIAIGGFVINIMFMLLIGVVAGICALFEWVCNKFRRKDEDDVETKY